MFKNLTGQKVTLLAIDTSTNAPKTGDSANLIAYVSKDDGAVTVLTDTSATELDATNAPGMYSFDVSQTECNADKLLFTGKSSTANIKIVPLLLYTRANNINDLVIDGSGNLTAGITGNMTGNLSGSVGSVTGAVASVTGAVGSVTGNVGGNVTGSVGSVVGAVGSVTGNVGGNVTGSVGSIASGGITSASLADGAITDAKITFPAESSGRPTTFLAAMRRVWEWTVNKRIRSRATGAVTLRNAADSADLETQTQSTIGAVGSEIDSQSKGV